MNVKSIGRALGRGLLRILIFAIRILPLPVALAVGRGIGNLMRTLARKRYQVALKNLRIAYCNELPESERQRIARECFRHFGMFLVEGIEFAYMPQAEVDRRVKITQYDRLVEILAGGKGAIFVCGHFGNFEIMGRWLSARGHELIALARTARDRGTTDIMIGLRERMGIHVVTLNQSLKPILAGLKRNACVAIICDQNAADVFVPFFGHMTGTVDGPARIARRTGAPLIFPYCIRDGRGGYEIVGHTVYEPEYTDDEKADSVRIMAEVNRRLEEIIRGHPEQWLWFHDRWKSSPDVQTPGDPVMR